MDHQDLEESPGSDHVMGVAILCNLNGCDSHYQGKHPPMADVQLYDKCLE